MTVGHAASGRVWRDENRVSVSATSISARSGIRKKCRVRKVPGLASVPYGMRLSQATVPVTPTNGLASNAPDGLALKLSVELLGPEALAAKILHRLLLENGGDDPP